MEIGEIISESVKYPSSNWKKVIILGILTLLSILIIPAFLVMGYILRTIKASIAGLDGLPEFDEWGEMFFDGLKVFVVEVVYFIIPLIVILAGVGASVISTQGLATLSTATMSLIGVTVLIGLILAAIFGLIATIAIANMAYYDSDLGAAFKFSEILEKISALGWGKYLVWYIVMIVILIIVGIITNIVNNIPFIGILISALLIYPYSNLLVARSIGLLFTSNEE